MPRWETDYLGSIRGPGVNELKRLVMWKTLVLGAAFTLASSAAFAAPQCNTRDSVLELLAQKYSEAPVAIGIANNGGLVEVLSTGDGNTWSIIITSPQGMSCLVAAGEGWRIIEQLAMDPEA